MPHAGQTWGPRSTRRETRGLGGQITCINFVAPKFLSMLKFLTAGSWAQKQKAKGALTPHNRWKAFNSCHQLSSVKFSWQKCLKQLQGHKWVPKTVADKFVVAWKPRTCLISMMHCCLHTMGPKACTGCGAFAGCQSCPGWEQLESSMQPWIKYALFEYLSQ